MADTNETQFLDSRVFPFKEVLQHFSQTGRTGRFDLRFGGLEGAIWLANGMAVHAVSPSGQGEEAFMECLCWKDATYDFEDGNNAPSATMNDVVQDLLLRHIMSGMEETYEAPQMDKSRNDTREIKAMPMISIVTLVVSSSEVPEFRHVVKDDNFTIGRDPENGLHVPDTSISRRHAQIQLAGDALLIKDLGSKNGTTIDGQPINQGIARAEQIVMFGEVICRVNVATVPKVKSTASVPSQQG